ncbi:COBRA-like protein 5, partial [Capsicum annuum]
IIVLSSASSWLPAPRLSLYNMSTSSTAFILPLEMVIFYLDESTGNFVTTGKQSSMGAETIEQGDYSKFKGNVPYCYKKDPVLVDLLPGVPYNQQFSNCCKGGVLASWGEDPSESVSSFQIGVGLAGTSNKTLKLPKNFTLLGPGPGYTCGPAKIVPSTVFLSPDHKRKSQAMSKFPFSASNFPRLLVIPSLQQQEIVFA